MGLEIVISGQYGGMDAGGAVQNIIVDCKKKLRKPIEVVANQNLKLKCNLYVSGEVTIYQGISGYSNIRFQLTKGYVSCDITMQSEIWKAGDVLMLKFFKSTLIEAICEIAQKLRTKSFFLDIAACKKYIENEL